MRTFLQRHFFTRAFMLFLVIGCINVFNATLIAWLCTQALGANLAFIIGYIISNVVAYILNSHFIFHAPLTLIRCLKFALSYVPNFLIQNVIVFIFYNLLGVPAILTYLIAAVLGVPVTFLAVKLFAFGRH